MTISVFLFFGMLANGVFAESPLQPIRDLTELPRSLQRLTLRAVVHSWKDRPTTESNLAHVVIPIDSSQFDETRDGFLIVDLERGRAEQAQMEIVARNGAGTAECVELIFPDRAVKGPNIRCVFMGKRSELPAMATESADWFKPIDPKQIVARARDALGQEYQAPLFETHQQTLKTGPLEIQREYFSALKPVQPNLTTYPQLLRCHTIVTQRWGEPFWDVGMLIENSSAENAAGTCALSELELGIENGVILPEESLLTEEFPVRVQGRVWTSVIPRRPDGKLNVIPDFFMTTKRFLVSTDEHRSAAREKLQTDAPYVVVPGKDPSGQETWSWNQFALFGPSRVGIPRGDGPRDLLVDSLNRETADFVARKPLLKKLGSFWVHGDPFGDAPSGEDIAFTNPLAVKWIQAGGPPLPWQQLRDEFKASLHRQRFGFFKRDGSLWTLADAQQGDGTHIPIHTPRLNIFSGRPHSEPSCFQFGRDTLPHRAWIKANLEAAKGQLPEDAEAFLAYTNYDDEHLCRFTQRLFALVWLSNDSIAKKILEMQASISLAAANPFPSSPDGDAVTGTVWELRKEIARQPHMGSYHLARGAGWNAQAILAGLATSKNPDLQRLGRTWLLDYARVWPQAQLPTGGVHRADGEQTASLDLNGNDVIDPDERAVPVEHGSVYMQGIFRFAAGRGMLFAFDPKRDTEALANHRSALKKLDHYFINQGWDDTVDLPAWNVAVVVKTRPTEVITKKVLGVAWGGSESSAFYFDDILAEAYLESGDDVYLQFLSRMRGGRLESINRAGGNSAHAAWVIDRARR
jgi:hypothetical protein